MEISTYISVLMDSLKTKHEVLQRIYQATERQSRALSLEEVDIETFDGAMEEKEQLLSKMQELDNGFESIYGKIREQLQREKETYKPQILEMQNLLRVITDLGVRIQALEQKNKVSFEGFVTKKRKEIKNFQSSNKTANTYYQHMANQHQPWQSYFMDKKK